MKKPRFLIVAWPEGHDENLTNHACEIQDAIDCDMGGPRVIMPLPALLERAIEQALGKELETL